MDTSYKQTKKERSIERYKKSQNINIFMIFIKTIMAIFFTFCGCVFIYTLYFWIKTWFSILSPTDTIMQALTWFVVVCIILAIIEVIRRYIFKLIYHLENKEEIDNYNKINEIRHIDDAIVDNPYESSLIEELDKKEHPILTRTEVVYEKPNILLDIFKLIGLYYLVKFFVKSVDKNK